MINRRVRQILFLSLGAVGLALVSHGTAKAADGAGVSSQLSNSVNISTSSSVTVDSQSSSSTGSATIGNSDQNPPSNNSSADTADKNSLGANQTQPSDPSAAQANTTQNDQTVASVVGQTPSQPSDGAALVSTGNDAPTASQVTAISSGWSLPPQHLYSHPALAEAPNAQPQAAPVAQSSNSTPTQPPASPIGAFGLGSSTIAPVGLRLLDGHLPSARTALYGSMMVDLAIILIGLIMAGSLFLQFLAETGYALAPRGATHLNSTFAFLLSGLTPIHRLSTHFFVTESLSIQAGPRLKGR